MPSGLPFPPLMAEVEPAEGALHEIDVTYDGEDLDWVCEYLGLSHESLIALHSDPVYDVRLLGSPGFVYLSDVPPEIAVPRLPSPGRWFRPARSASGAARPASTAGPAPAAGAFSAGRQRSR